MLTFRPISSKTIKAPFDHEVNGYKIRGHATYNKDNRVSDVDGQVTTAEGRTLGSFYIYGCEDGGMRINFSDCHADKMNDLVEVANTTLEDLSNTYPKE